MSMARSGLSAPDPRTGCLVGVPAVAAAVYAHPDDPHVACGGTLALWAHNGCAVHVVICAQGEKGTADPGCDAAELARLRAQEAREASGRIGVATQYLIGVPDGELDEASLRAELVGWIRRVRPDVLICPDPTAVFFGSRYYNHRDHRVVGWAALDAAVPAAASPGYFPELGPAHAVAWLLLTGTLEPDAWVDIGSTLEVKVEAVGCHGTQLPGGLEQADGLVRDRARQAGKRAGVEYAEEFRWLVGPGGL